MGDGDDPRNDDVSARARARSTGLGLAVVLRAAGRSRAASSSPRAAASTASATPARRAAAVRRVPVPHVVDQARAPMEILHTDSVFRVAARHDAELQQRATRSITLMRLMRADPARGRSRVVPARHLQDLFPIDSLELYGPAGGDADLLDPTRQDNKTDFQKQNVKSISHLGRHALVRGWVTTGDWTGPFLRLSYRAGPIRRCRNGRERLARVDDQAVAEGGRRRRRPTC